MTEPPKMLPVPGERSVREWIGATPDAAIPPRVKLRVLKRHDFRCYLTRIEIKPGDTWEIEHIVAITNGGEHRESNLAPALKEAHRGKTRIDLQIKSKRERSQKRRYGITKSKTPLPGGRDSSLKRCMDGTVIDRRTGEVVYPRKDLD